MNLPVLAAGAGDRAFDPDLVIKAVLMCLPAALPLSVLLVWLAVRAMREGRLKDGPEP